MGGDKPGAVLALQFSVDVEASLAFTLDTRSAVLAPRAPAFWHHRATVRRRSRGCAPRRRPGWTSQRREERPTMRIGGVVVPCWCGEHDFTIRPLNVTPAARSRVERLDQVVIPNA